MRKRPTYPLIIAGISFLLFIMLLTGVMTQANWVSALDSAVIRWAIAYRPSWLTHGLLAITTLGNPVNVTLLGMIFALVLLWLRQNRYAVFAVITLGGMSGINHLIKGWVKRPRPFIAEPTIHPLVTAGGYSFPSGHSSGTMLLYGTVILVCWALLRHQWAKILITAGATAMILLTGFSRIYVQVHFPTDVLAGYTSALAGLMLVWWLMWTWLHRQAKVDQQVKPRGEHDRTH